MAYYGYKPAEQAIQIGDNTIVSADIADGSIVNADLNSSAAIAMSKTQFVAGTGLTLATNTVNVDAAQTQITSVGTIGTGVWQGTAVASAYLDADTAHLSGTQTFSGAKTFSAAASFSANVGFTANVSLNDNDLLQLGSGDDLRLYHDGSNSYIKSTTGWLNMPIGGSGISIANSDFSESIAKFLPDGACELYHNGTKRIETTSSGVTVAGDVKVGGSDATLGLMIEYDQSSATTTKITSNPTYTNTSALMHLCVDGDANANQLVLKGDGGIGIGTNAPLGGRLHVQGKELLMRSPGGTNQFYVWGVDANENNCGVSIYQDDGTQTIQLHTDGASYFTGGGIGIGLTSPQTHGATAGIHLANSTELGFGDGANNRPDFGITGDSDHLNIFCGEGSDDVDTKWDTNGNMFIQNGSLWVSNGIKTSVSSASKATGNYFDVFTVPNDPLKMILAHSTITGSDGPGNYNRVDLVFGAGGSYKIVNLDDTSYMNAQMSGSTYQVQQTSGGTQTISTRWLIIA